MECEPLYMYSNGDYADPGGLRHNASVGGAAAGAAGLGGTAPPPDPGPHSNLTFLIKQTYSYFNGESVSAFFVVSWPPCQNSARTTSAFHVGGVFLTSASNFNAEPNGGSWMSAHQATFVFLLKLKQRRSGTETRMVVEAQNSSSVPTIPRQFVLCRH